MKFQIISVASHSSEHLTALIQSAERLELDMRVLICEWKGFGTKVIELRNYLKSADCTHFIFVDAYDTLFLRKPDYAGGIIFSTEKHKWPDVDAPYKETKHVWQYLNSGCFAAPVKEFLEITDKYPIEYADDDQRYYTNIFLDGGIELDYQCKLFQSYAFEEPEDFTLMPFKNNITGSEPAVIHFNGKCHDKRIYNMIKFDTLQSVKEHWKDAPETHKEIHESFIEKVNDVPDLKAHRDFVDQHIHGFGERSFLWMWYLIIQEMPQEFTFLEIGIFRGQTLSLVELIASMQGKKAIRYGITPLSTEGGVWESDYKADIEFIHNTFNLSKDYQLLVGLSEDEKIIKQAGKLKLDILYIDGGHEERHIHNDIDNYHGLIKPGGYMVIDDCCNSFRMPFGYFQGIDSVTKVVDEKLPPHSGSNEFEFIISVVHNRIYRKV